MCCRVGHRLLLLAYFIIYFLRLRILRRATVVLHC
jgi:hypothetical protein